MRSLEREDAKKFEPFIRLSEALNREIGICECRDGRAFLTIGNECSTLIYCECDPEIIFHTHPKGDDTPSIKDVDAIIRVSQKVTDADFCIGSLDGDDVKVNCIRVGRKTK